MSAPQKVNDREEKFALLDGPSIARKHGLWRYSNVRNHQLRRQSRYRYIRNEEFISHIKWHLLKAGARKFAIVS